MKTRQTLAALAIALLAGAPSTALRAAGSNADDEAAIRKQIAAYDAGGSRAIFLPDRVFWSGAYKRPVVGSEPGEPFDGQGGIGSRVPNSQKSKTEVIRIVVSDSRDLAYEYSKSTLEFDLKSGSHVSMQTGLLRVWQKQNGDWKIAAFFTHPYDRPPR
jgi:ketosteroid isomerase-like protein